MLKLLAIIILLVSSSTLQSRDSLEFDFLLSKHLDLLGNQVKDSELDFSAAWFHDIVLRSETDHFELDRQEYSLRFSPVSPWVQSAQESLFKSSVMKYKQDLNESKADYLEELYEDWLNLLFDQKEIELLSEILALCLDEDLVRSKMIENSSKDIDDYLKFREKKHGTSLKLSRLLMEYRIKKYNLFISVDIDTVLFINPEVIRIEEIKQMSGKLKEIKIFKKTAGYNELKIENDIVINEIKVEEAENSKIFDFLQLAYQGPNDDPMNERLSLMFALRLPLSGRNKMKTELLRVEEQELENKMIIEEENFLHKLSRQIAQLEVLFSQFDITENHNKTLVKESTFLSENLSTLSNSPLWLISNKKSIIKNKLELLDISKDIYLEYVSLLSLIGYFETNPKVNYLKEIP